MPKKIQKAWCSPAGIEGNCCRVESVISSDEQRQMVVPKELRDRANIRAGDGCYQLGEKGVAVSL